MRYGLKRVKNPMSRKILKSENWMYPITFLITIFLFLIILIYSQTYPWGSKSVIISDLSNQYIDFYGFLRRILLGHENIIYNWKIGLGSGVLPFAANSLLSPFNIFLVFFKEEDIQLAILFITILKIATMSISCLYLLKGYGDVENKILMIGFSIAYSLSSYTIFYKAHIMWFDALILLPLIVHELKLMQNIKILNIKLIFLLFIGICANFYTGYMICLSTPIFLLYFNITFNNGLNWKSLIGSFSKLALNGILAALLSAFLLVPTFISILGGHEQNLMIMGETGYDFWSIWYAFLIGAFKTWTPSGTLPLYAGILTLLATILTFFSREVPNYKKKCIGFILFLFFLSYYVRPLYLFWHGMDYPSWFEGRFSFILILYMILIAFDSLQNTRIARESLIKAVIIIVFLTTICFFLKPDVWNKNLLLSFFFILLYVICLIKRNNLRIICNIALMLLILMELMLNAVISINQYEESASPYDEYTSFQDKLKVATNELELKEFERIEKDFYRRENDWMSCGYNGISIFSSIYNGMAHKTLGKMGITSEDKIIRYEGTTLFTDTLLGIKYILSHDLCKPGFEKISSREGITAFFNPLYQGPFLGIRKYQEEAFCDKTFENPFDYQNYIAEQFFQYDSLYMPIKMEPILQGEAVQGTSKNMYYKGNGEANLEFYINKPLENEIRYFYMDLYKGEIDISINEKNISSFCGYTNKIINIDDYADDNYPAKVSIELKSEITHIKDMALVQFNPIQFKQHLDNNKLAEIQISNIASDNNILLAVSNPNECTLFTSIPYSSGWDIYVNGVSQKCNILLDGFIGVDLEPGYNEIQMVYTQPGLKEGILLSSIGLIIIIVYLVRNYEQKGNKRISKT